VEFPDLTQGRCREVGDMFFYPDSENEGDTSMYAFGKAICSSCIVKQQCLDWAIRHEGYGLWGGMTPRERMAERRKLNIQLESIIPGDYV
jgi:WhiB family redox-sensing transcriptional regulator